MDTLLSTKEVFSSDIKQAINKQKEQLLILEDRMKVTQIAVKRLQTDFNSLVAEFERTKDDLKVLKTKQACGTTFSHIFYHFKD